MKICRAPPQSLQLLYASLGQIEAIVLRAAALLVGASNPLAMLAALFTTITSRHRAWAFALAWLLAVTIMNVQTDGAYRSTLLFAIPVAAVAWNDWRLGFLFAGLAILAAKYGHAMPEPGSPRPEWVDGLVAFGKLSVDAVVANAWGRRLRLRREPASRPDDLPGGGAR